MRTISFLPRGDFYTPSFPLPKSYPSPTRPHTQQAPLCQRDSGWKKEVFSSPFLSGLPFSSSGSQGIKGLPSCPAEGEADPRGLYTNHHLLLLFLPFFSPICGCVGGGRKKGGTRWKNGRGSREKKVVPSTSLPSYYALFRSYLGRSSVRRDGRERRKEGESPPLPVKTTNLDAGSPHFQLCREEYILKEWTP